jgi:hypothetical protein
MRNHKVIEKSNDRDNKVIGKAMVETNSENTNG